MVAYRGMHFWFGPALPGSLFHCLSNASLISHIGLDTFLQFDYLWLQRGLSNGLLALGLLDDCRVARRGPLLWRSGQRTTTANARRRIRWLIPWIGLPLSLLEKKVPGGFGRQDKPGSHLRSRQRLRVSDWNATTERRDVRSSCS